MPINIECDDCGNKYRVSDEKAGSKVRCKECGARIDVPGGDRDLFGEDEAPRRSSPSKKRKGKSAGSQSGVIIGVGAIAAVCLIGVVLFVVFSRRGGQPPQVAQVNQPVPASTLPNSNPVPTGFPISNNTAPPAASVNTLPTAPGSSLPNATLPAAGLPNATPAAGLPSSTNVAALPSPAPNGGAAPAPATRPALAERPAGGRRSGFGGFATGNSPAGAGATGVDFALPENWNVKLDPSKLEVKFENTKPMNIKFPKDGQHDSVTYPMTPSVYVALGAGSFNQPVREIWNLATRSKTGSVGIKSVHGRALEALSPDGQYLAATMDKFFEKKSGVRVWAVKGSKPLGELQTGPDVTAVFFPGPLRLMALCKGGTAYVWKLPSGELEHELQLGTAELTKAVAVSPGGNYLAALVGKSTLQVFDLNTGKLVGEQGLPVTSNSFVDKTDAISFSPDGVELAMIVPSGTWDQALVIYNFADGKLLSTAELNTQDISSRDVAGNRLEWFADRSKLLWRGHYVLDAKIGGPVWSAPQEDGSSDAPRKLLDGTRIVVVAGGRKNPSLITAPVPIDDINAAAETVANGGEAVEAGMSPVSKSDYSKMIPVASNATAAWSMQPDPATSGGNVKTSIPLPPQRPGLGGIHLSRPDVGRALVWYSNNPRVKKQERLHQFRTVDPPGGRDTLIMDVIDLTNGKVKGPIALRYPGSVHDVSPDGDLVAMTAANASKWWSQDRLDLYSITEDKHTVSWRPFRKEEDSAVDIEEVVLLDHEYCLTVNKSEMAIMWKLPECQAVWRMEGGHHWCLSPGGKYLGFQSGKRFAFLEARTGNLVGDIVTDLTGLKCAFHPIGTHFALLGSDSISRKLIVVDVATGKSTANFFTPQGDQKIEWCGDAHLLVDGKWLVDLQLQKNVWTYELQYGCEIANQPDGKHWFVTGAGSSDPNLFLSAATLPDKTVLTQVAANPPTSEGLLQPGMQINLQVNLTALPPSEPNLAAETAKSYQAAMEKAGFTVGAGGHYAFVITTAPGKAEGTMELRPLDGKGAAVTVAVTAIDCEVNLMSNGESLWKHRSPVTNRAFGIQHLKPGEDITSHLAKQMWGSLSYVLKNLPVPRQIFSANAGAGVGKSVFVPGGAQTVTN